VLIGKNKMIKIISIIRKCGVRVLIDLVFVRMRTSSWFL